MPQPKKNIIVSGSLAFDRIMNFSGRFKDNILPDKIHILNVSFVVDDVKENFGGTAGNIAYNLSLLGENPKILGVAGEDFDKYEKWFKHNDVDVSLVRKVKGASTASAHIITDQDDNQITGFYPGPLDNDYCKVATDFSEQDYVLAIIAPEVKMRMIEYFKIYQKMKIPYIFDPGQQVSALSGDELSQAIAGAKVLIGNDYEIQIICNKIGNTPLTPLKRGTARIGLISSPLSEGTGVCNLAEIVKILVITKGAEGSEIYENGKKIIIPPAKPENTSDPTGAGDAYRAGFIKGLINGWSLEKTGRLAGLVAVYTVEKYGTQTHSFTLDELEKRYEENFGTIDKI
ncbi:carbohydrate kinase family protein [Patescibacteria group bacterium]